MDTSFTILLGIYTFILIGGGIAALVLQVRDDLRHKNKNLLDGWRLSWIDAGLIAWGIVIAAVMIMMVLNQISEKIPDPHWGIALHLVGWQGGLLVILLLLIRLYPAQFNLSLSPVRLDTWQTLRQAVLQVLAAVVLLGIIAYCWKNALLLLQEYGMGNFLREQELVSLLGRELSLGIIITMLVAAVIIAPIAEELLFRGLFYRFLKSRMSARNAMIISSVCFGALHYNALSFLPLVFFGMVLTRAYEHTGNLKVPILMHALFNANTVFLVLCEPYIAKIAETAAGN